LSSTCLLVFSTDPATPELYTRSLHDALPISHRAARPVGDDGRREAGPVAAVLPVDVLDDLLAALVLEIDVDVGRLAPLGGEEARSEEHTSELQSRENLVCRLLLEKKKENGRR